MKVLYGMPHYYNGNMYERHRYTVYVWQGTYTGKGFKRDVQKKPPKRLTPSQVAR